MDPIRIDCYGNVKTIENIKLSSYAGVDNPNSKFVKSTKEYSFMMLSKMLEQSLELRYL